jgi:hypothetical protein
MKISTLETYGNDLLELIRLVPLPKAIPWLLAHCGGEIDVSELFQITSSPKTLLNVLGSLEKAGELQMVGSKVVARHLPDTYPKLCPTPTRHLPEAIPDIAPDTLPTHTRDLPEAMPDFGQAVNDDKSVKSAEKVSPISISSLSSLEKEITKPKTKEQKNTKTLSAFSSWAALLENPSFHLPLWLDQPLWAQWLEDLGTRKLKVTPGALREQLDKLKACEDAGFPQTLVIKTAISRGWKSVGEPDWFTPKATAPTRSSPRAKSGTTEENMAVLQAAFGVTAPPSTEVL